MPIFSHQPSLTPLPTWARRPVGRNSDQDIEQVKSVFTNPRTFAATQNAIAFLDRRHDFVMSKLGSMCVMCYTSLFLGREAYMPIGTPEVHSRGCRAWSFLRSALPRGVEEVKICVKAVKEEEKVFTVFQETASRQYLALFDVETDVYSFGRDMVYVISKAMQYPFQDMIQLESLKYKIDAILKRDGAGSSVATFSYPKYMRLIDLHDMCIIDVDNITGHVRPYIALSYVWETDSSATRLTRRNISQLTRPNALSSPSCRIPDNIKGVGALCKILGYRFLWIDRLCIVQGEDAHDPSLEMKYIEVMGHVYNNANLTICLSTVGEEGRPIRGLPAVSNLKYLGGAPPRIAPRSADIIHAGKSQNPRCFGDLARQQPHMKAWCDRGWTLQEQILSRVTLFIDAWSVSLQTDQLYFLDNEVWSQRTWPGCRPSLQKKPLHLDVPPSSTAPHQTAKISVNALDTGKDLIVVKSGFAGLSKLYSKYSTRNLSHQSDLQNAFAGLTAAIERQNSTESHFHHTERFFPQTLCWGLDADSRIRDPALPSWSWIRYSSVSWRPEVFEPVSIHLYIVSATPDTKNRTKLSLNTIMNELPRGKDVRKFRYASEDLRQSAIQSFKPVLQEKKNANALVFFDRLADVSSPGQTALKMPTSMPGQRDFYLEFIGYSNGTSLPKYRRVHIDSQKVVRGGPVTKEPVWFMVV